MLFTSVLINLSIELRNADNDVNRSLKLSLNSIDGLKASIKLTFIPKKSKQMFSGLLSSLAFLAAAHISDALEHVICLLELWLIRNKVLNSKFFAAD